MTKTQLKNALLGDKDRIIAKEWQAAPSERSVEINFYLDDYGNETTKIANAYVVSAITGAIIQVDFNEEEDTFDSFCTRVAHTYNKMFDLKGKNL